VSAIDRNTGREAVAVFTSSGLEPSGDPAGTYRLEGLPAGSYMISVHYLRRAEHSMNTGWRWADATQTDYNATVNMANLDPVLVAPELLSNSESAADDLSAPLVIDLADGEEVILPDLVANTDFPDAPAESVQLNMGNNGLITGIPIGFSFPFYGTSYTQFVAYANGYLSLGVGFEDPITFDESGSRFFNLPRISALMRELDPSADGLGAGQGGPDIYVMLGATSVETIWLSIPEEVPGAQTGSDSPTPSGANTFSIGFDNAGHIWLEYRKIASPFGIGGLASGVGQIGVKEKFDFGRPRIVDANRATLENALRLSGVRIDFVPNINGSYVVSSPQWVAPEVAPPEGVGRLEAQGGQETQLSWPATGDAGYHVYRGSIADLSATGTYTAAGTCFRAVTAPETLDAMSPAGGEAFYYIVTSVREFGIEGPLGHNDLGIERPNAFPCVL
ncbi:MAG: hypothetical protein O7F16_07615, partial [Acidobacteria bacterium]|nr:hypothetical protein [Acidobacteriota bacterium]